MSVSARLRARGDEANIRRAEFLRAARVLAIQSRREATGLFAGSFASAFRGSGMVFEESRPYVPGDDTRRMDWNAMARTGQPFIKHFHEERDRTVEIVLDTSASMAVCTTTRTPAQVGAHVAALLSAVAGRTGDRVGLTTFGDGAPRGVSPARGTAHAWRVVEAATHAAEQACGDATLEETLAQLSRRTETNAIVFLISDFRTSRLTERSPRALPLELTRIASRSDLVSIVIEDSGETTLSDVGRIRIVDPEQPGRTLLIDTSDLRFRARYAERARARRRDLERDLRHAGSDIIWLRSDRAPLRVLSRFFHERSARLGIGPV